MWQRLSRLRRCMALTVGPFKQVLRQYLYGG
ncbi:hypothetical protein F0726_00182 [Acidithiobacillus caldus]|nr:hypothetical protein F0726_00182 [Acidithiobacillus caldus]